MNFVHQQFIRLHEMKSHGGGDTVSKKNCSFVDEREHASVTCSLLDVKRTCRVTSVFELSDDKV
jgi:hypothetical protein